MLKSRLDMRCQEEVKMAKFLILGEPFGTSDPLYRGTYRTYPSYVENDSSNSVVNTYFHWFVQQGGELGIVYDRKKALETVEAYAKLNQSQHFEVIRLLGEKDESGVGEEFIGFDICSKSYYSPLAWKFYKHSEEEFSAAPLLQLAQKYFTQLLNDKGLFSDKGDAEFCLQCLQALDVGWPNLFESGDSKCFEVVGLSIVVK
jgi:hypothetical protein